MVISGHLSLVLFFSNIICSQVKFKRNHYHRRTEISSFYGLDVCVLCSNIGFFFFYVYTFCINQDFSPDMLRDESGIACRRKSVLAKGHRRAEGKSERKSCINYCEPFVVKFMRKYGCIRN